MAKRTQNIQHTQMTKRQRARWEQDRIKQRRLLIIVGSVIGIAALLIGLGLLIDKVIVPGGTVAKFSNGEITNGEYQLYRQITQAQRAYTTAQQYDQYVQFQGAEQLTAQITSDIDGLKQKNAPLDYDIIDRMIDQKILFDNAATNNVNVTYEDAARELLKEIQPPTTDTTAPISPTGTLTDTAALTPTATIAPTTVPTDGDVDVQLSSQINTYYSTMKEFYETGSQFGLATLPFSVNDFKRYFINGKREDMIRTKLGESLVTEDKATKEVYADADQIFVRVTVAPTDTAELSSTLWLQGKEKIDQAAAELKSGKPFTDVQALFSDYKPDVSGKSPSGIRALSDYAQFSITEPISTQQVGVVGEPYRSEQGWHLVWVKQRELRPNQSDLGQKRGEAIGTWLENKRKELNVQRVPEPTATPAPPTVEPLPTEVAPEAIPTPTP